MGGSGVGNVWRGVEWVWAYSFPGVILTNPPFGGMEEDGTEKNFPATYRTKETADLFVVLNIHLLCDGGRGAIVLPDGTLFGEGVKTRIKQELLADWQLLLEGFRPYAPVMDSTKFSKVPLAPMVDLWRTLSGAAVPA